MNGTSRTMEESCMAWEIESIKETIKTINE